MKKFLILLSLLLIGNTSFAAKLKPIDITYNDGVYQVVLRGDKIKKKVSFYASNDLKTNKEIHKASRAKLTVNAGFFDPETGKTISYVVSDYATVEDPRLNESLLNNPALKQHLNKVYNRTEFRVIQCDDTNKLRYEIVSHNAPVDFGCSIKTSAQGGPLILPELRLEEEAFIIKKDGVVVRESCSVLQKVARTIIGLKDDDAYILIFTDEHPVTLQEVQEYCQKLGLDRAMAFDGGSSTSMNYLDKIDVISTKGDGAGRRLKSFLLVH